MTIRTPKEAIRASLGQTTNVPGTCQMVTRGWFNAPSAGDQDRDGDADAIDGWLSEPLAQRRFDRNAPAGYPIAFRNRDRNGFGHRALMLPDGKVRSTDFDTATQRYKKGVVGTANSIEILERAMSLVYLGWSKTISGIQIPKDEEPLPKPSRLVKTRKIAHVSGQFSDSDRAHRHDIDKIFSQNWSIITGTEAGEGAGNTNEMLEYYAKIRGYRLVLTDRYDTWVAIRRTNIVEGSFKKGAIHVADKSSVLAPSAPGTWGDKAIVWGQYEDKDLGLITIGAMHPLTRGGAGDRIKALTDEAFATKAASFGRRYGKGNQLVFLNGDMNKNDRVADVFMGAPFTTCWDELKIWPNTLEGHRTTIDVISSYDHDGRVECRGARRKTDEKFFLNTDHFAIVADYEIKQLLD